LLGSAVVQKLASFGYHNLLLPARAELDLLDRDAVNAFYEREAIDTVILTAAIVGGAGIANINIPRLYQNIEIQHNVIYGAYKHGIPNLLFVSSACVYPKDAPQPISETSLWQGALEEVNKPYAVAKLAGMELIDTIRKEAGFNYLTVLINNLFGIKDRFDPKNSHVVAGLIRRIVEAKAKGYEKLIIAGTASREIMFSDDCADAIIFLLKNGLQDFSYINIGSGDDINLLELAKLISEIVGYTGEVVNDPSLHRGMLHRTLDSTKLQNLGWEPKTSLCSGLKTTIDWWSNQVENKFD